MLRKQSGSQGGATFGLNLKHVEKKYKNFCYIDEPYAEKSSSRRQKSLYLVWPVFFQLGVWEQIN